MNRKISPELKAYAKLDENIKHIIQEDIKKDKEIQKLGKKLQAYITSGDTARARKTEQQLQERTEFFITIWMRQAQKTQLTAHNGFMLIEDTEERETYIWRLCLSWFLADFLQDIYIEMENTVRKYYPSESIQGLHDFFLLKDKVGAYMREALKGETDETVEFFDTHAASIKMMFHNKAQGYKNALIQKESEQQKKDEMKERQLSLDFQ